MLVYVYPVGGAVRELSGDCFGRIVFLGHVQEFHDSSIAEASNGKDGSQHRQTLQVMASGDQERVG